MPQSQGAYLMKKSLTFLLLVCASLAVAGCGSSSGGPLIIVTPTPAPTATATAVPSATPTATATPPPTSILLNGSAFQGAIVTNETILAYSVDPTDGSNLAFLGATTADNTGNFNLTISPVPTGPMRVIADGGNLTSAMDGTTIPAPGDWSSGVAGRRTGAAARARARRSFTIVPPMKSLSMKSNASNCSTVLVTCT